MMILSSRFLRASSMKAFAIHGNLLKGLALAQNTKAKSQAKCFSTYHYPPTTSYLARKLVFDIYNFILTLLEDLCNKQGHMTNTPGTSGNKISALTVSLKWVKSNRCRKKERKSMKTMASFTSTEAAWAKNVFGRFTAFYGQRLVTESGQTPSLEYLSCDPTNLLVGLK